MYLVITNYSITIASDPSEQLREATGTGLRLK